MWTIGHHCHHSGGSWYAFESAPLLACPCFAVASEQQFIGIYRKWYIYGVEWEEVLLLSRRSSCQRLSSTRTGRYKHGHRVFRNRYAASKTPLSAWKYITPTDLTVSCVDTNGKTWKFCTKCKCRATGGAVGIYQLSHYDAEHVDDYRRPAGSIPAASPTALLDTSVAPPDVPSATMPTAPKEI